MRFFPRGQQRTHLDGIELNEGVLILSDIDQMFAVSFERGVQSGQGRVPLLIEMHHLLSSFQLPIALAEQNDDSREQEGSEMEIVSRAPLSENGSVVCLS